MKNMITDAELYESARRARASSYSPYSNITVGAALLSASGKVYTGANVENAAFSPSVCAERVAFLKAVNDGELEFLKIAVAGGKRNEKESDCFPPCGVCRQVMAEFCNKDFKIVLSEHKSVSLAELLPFGFDKELIK